VIEMIKGVEKLNTYLTNGAVKKIIYVPWKIMNIVIG
jgi:hypothetical protein